MRRPAAAALLGVVLVSPVLAQDRVPFPFDVVSAEAATRELLLRPRLERLGALAELREVIFEAAPLPDGSVVDLELERISLERLRLGLRLDGEPVPGYLDALELSVWVGRVVGRLDSDVHLALSNAGCSGWIHRGDDLTHLLPRRGGDGRFGSGDVLATTEGALVSTGPRNEFTCEALRAPGDEVPLPPTPPDFPPAATCGPKECSIALEGDYQLSLIFADPPAMVAYVTALLGYVSNRFEIQTNTVLTFPYFNLWTTPDDPWTSQDQGGNCIDVLYEFEAAWTGNIPEDARIGHMLSGANLGCGVAYLDILCYDAYNFSVSGNINGDVNFPVQQQPSNWDFMVIAHELGHNFGAPHTHDWCPPLDECPPQQYWGACQDETLCTSLGTVMSYCHLCTGGTANITTWFHVNSGLLMAQQAQACLPDYLHLAGTVPELLSPGALPLVTASAKGDGEVSVYYRYDDGTFDQLPMTEGETGELHAWLPQVKCGDEVEVYFRMLDADCGQVVDPPGAPSEPYSVPVGMPILVMADDFEEDTGWTREVLGADEGLWERGVPVGDVFWAYAPLSDADGSGSCWLTGNQAGNSDVDGGAVRLTSPPIDLSTGQPLLAWWQWAYLTDAGAQSFLSVEVSENGGLTWVEVLRESVGTGAAWVPVTLGPGDLAAVGVDGSADVQVRFTAADESGSIVEVALDGFTASVLSCAPIGQSYCGPANLNSTGSPGVLFAAGSTQVADNQVSLTAAQLPAGMPGMFINSLDPGFVPFPSGSKGNLCLSGDIGRYADEVQAVAEGGWMSITLDLTATPTPAGPVSIQPGETWYFQAWCRDVHPDPTSNFTDGVEVAFD